jgi:hypothetical protein
VQHRVSTTGISHIHSHQEKTTKRRSSLAIGGSLLVAYGSRAAPAAFILLSSAPATGLAFCICSSSACRSRQVLKDGIMNCGPLFRLYPRLDLGLSVDAHRKLLVRPSVFLAGGMKYLQIVYYVG